MCFSGGFFHREERGLIWPLENGGGYLKSCLIRQIYGTLVCGGVNGCLDLSLLS